MTQEAVTQLPEFQTGLEAVQLDPAWQEKGYLTRDEMDETLATAEIVQPGIARLLRHLFQGTEGD